LGLPATPRLSTVVLPFANLSDDREQEYFADRITEDVTIDLSRITDLFMKSRKSAVAPVVLRRCSPYGL
jgi:TolB-like protein